MGYVDKKIKEIKEDIGNFKDYIEKLQKEIIELEKLKARER